MTYCRQTKLVISNSDVAFDIIQFYTQTEKNMKKSIKHCKFADKAVSYDWLRLGVLSHQAPIIVLPIRKPTKITTENFVFSPKKNTARKPFEIIHIDHPGAAGASFTGRAVLS